MCAKSRQSCSTLWCCRLQPTRLLCPWDSPSNNIGVGYHALLQGICPTWRSNPCLLCLLHWQVDSLPLGPPGKPFLVYGWAITYICFFHLCSKNIPRSPTTGHSWGPWGFSMAYLSLTRHWVKHTVCDSVFLLGSPQSFWEGKAGITCRELVIVGDFSIYTHLFSKYLLKTY